MVHQAEVQGVRQAALLVVLLEVRRGVLREIQGVLAAVLEVGVHRKEFLAGFSHLGVQKGSDEGRCHRRLGLGPGLPLPSAEGEGSVVFRGELVQRRVATCQGAPRHQTVRSRCIWRVLGWWYLRGAGANVIDGVTRDP